MSHSNYSEGQGTAPHKTAKRGKRKAAPAVGAMADVRPRREIQGVGRNQQFHYDEHGRKRAK